VPARVLPCGFLAGAEHSGKVPLKVEDQMAGRLPCGNVPGLVKPHSACGSWLRCAALGWVEDRAGLEDEAFPGGVVDRAAAAGTQVLQQPLVLQAGHRDGQPPGLPP
jgi:hypothetical protein